MDLAQAHFSQLWNHPTTIRMAALHPAMLLLLTSVALPLVLRKHFAPLATWSRVAAMAAVVLALAGLRLTARLPDQRHSFVAAIDVSDSIDVTGREWATLYVQELARSLGPEDELAVLTFAGDTRIVSAQASPDVLAEDLPLPRTRNATDIERAIDTAMAIFPSDTQRRLLVLSDGHETRGVARDQIARLRAAKVPIDVIVPPHSAKPDVALDKLVVPATMTEDQAVPMQIVTFNSGRTRSAVFNLLLDDLIVESAAVDIPGGTARFDFPYRVGERGHHRLRAELQLDDDAFTSNNARDLPIVVSPGTRLLLVTARDHSPLARALSRKGIAVETVAPQQMPAAAEVLARYQTVILEDPTAATVSPAAAAALQRYVHDEGGGLIVAGGGATFGDERFKTTALRPLLPITLEPRRPKRTERDPLALYLVIDRSNSMGYNSRIGTLRDGEKLRYAKEAALTVIRQLKDHDLVGVIAFDSQPWEVSPLLPLRENRALLEKDIPRLVENGGTDFFDALVSARKQLHDARVNRRHIILLTDGDTNRAQMDDYARLLADMKSSEITITTVRIGDDTVNLKLLQTISEATGGVFHHVEDAQQLPDLMLRDASRTLEPMQPDSDQFFSQVGMRHQLLRGINAKAMPALAGYAYARPKPGADVVLRIARGDRHDPLLTVWQYGLGRVAAFTASPTEDAETWLGWNELSKFWSQLAGWTGRLHGAADVAVDARRRDGIVELRLRTYDRIGNEAALRARLNTEDGALHEVAFVQGGPREFIGRLPDLPAGNYPLTITRRNDRQQISERTEVVHIPAGEVALQEEQPPRHPNTALLTQLADGTGGKMNPNVRDLLDDQPGSRRMEYPLDHVLLPLAMLLFLADVAVRRLLVYRSDSIQS
jgi:Mg-chelatase subunit ChlD